jgi:hypothetical protein
MDITAPTESPHQTTPLDFRVLFMASRWMPRFSSGRSKSRKPTGTLRG